MAAQVTSHAVRHRHARPLGFLGPPQVTFTRAAHFVRNRVIWNEGTVAPPSPSSPHPSPPPSASASSSGPRAHPCGGGLSVGNSGRVSFWELASFEGNSALRGGALCNRGWVKFFRRSFFNENFATGGEAGARPALALAQPYSVAGTLAQCVGACSCLRARVQR